jgi:2'-5' RNA ligase
MRIPLDAVGAFPQPKRARVVWVGPAKAVRAFASLCAAVRKALEPLGFSFEAHNDAHVTIARADGRTALPPVVPPRGIVVRADALRLYRSITAAEGAKYEPLDRARLREDS